MDLDLPKRKRPDHFSMETSPDSLRAWVDKLPLLNTEMTRQLLVDVLARINQLDLLPDNRNELLEILSTSVMCVIDALKKDFLGKPLPLQTQDACKADQALELCNLLATGFRVMVDDLGVHDAQNHQLAVAIHRSLRHLSEILLGHYQIYRHYPEGLWRSIHSLYALAKECGNSKLSITDTTLPTTDTSNIETIYKQILLLSLACPYRLQQKEIHFAYNALIDWASFCLIQPADSGVVNGLFAINLLSDDPPAYRDLHSDEETDLHHTCILDTRAVADRLRAVLENADRNKTGFGNKDALQQLILSWGAMPRRRFPRQTSSATLPVKLVVGLNSIHHLVDGPQVKAHQSDDTIMDSAWLQDPTFDRTVNIDINPYFSGDRTNTSVEESKETWKTEEILLRGSYTADSPGAENIEFWKIADMSAAGYCLLWENSHPSNAQIGELVAIINQEEQAHAAWQLGVIRWMKFTPDRGLELGVQMLSPGARAVWAYVVNDEVGRHIAAINKMQGILLPGIEALSQQDSLILPCLPFRTGCSSILEISDDTQNIVLTRQLENTGRFAQYHYTPQDAETL